MVEVAASTDLTEQIVGGVLGRRSDRRGFVGLGEGRIVVVVEEGSLEVLVAAAAVELAVAEEGSRSRVVRRERPVLGRDQRKSGGCRRVSRSGQWIALGEPSSADGLPRALGLEARHRDPRRVRVAVFVAVVFARLKVEP